MSDVKQSVPDNQNNLQRLFVDMGDGTYAERVVAVVEPASGSNRTGVSGNNTVDTSGTSVVVAAAAYTTQFCVQNTEGAKTIYLSFTSPVTSSDFKLLPGASMNFNFGNANALYGLSSSGSAAFAVTGA